MCKPFHDVHIYVPSENQIIRIAEGTGDNLLPEDEERGYVDYIYYDVHALRTDYPNIDGGMIMRTALIRDEFESMEDCIPIVLEFIFQDAETKYILLKKED